MPPVAAAAAGSGRLEVPLAIAPAPCRTARLRRRTIAGLRCRPWPPPPLAARYRGLAWSNWAGNQSCAPVEIRRPTSEDELVRIVKQAAAAGAAGEVRRRRPQLHADRLHRRRAGRPRRLRPGARARPRGRRRSPCRPASRSRGCATSSTPRGLALENMGDIAYQSIAGATPTATHGTGWRFRNLSSRIVGCG